LISKKGRIIKIHGKSEKIGLKADKKQQKNSEKEARK